MKPSAARACSSATVSARRNGAKPESRDCATSSARDSTACHIARHSITGSDTRRSTTSACCSAGRSILTYSLVWTNLSPMARRAIVRQYTIRSSIGAKQFASREFVGWVTEYWLFEFPFRILRAIFYKYAENLCQVKSSSVRALLMIWWMFIPSVNNNNNNFASSGICG